MKKIIIEITGDDEIDAEEVAEMVFERLAEDGYDVEVVGYEQDEMA